MADKLMSLWKKGTCKRWINGNVDVIEGRHYRGFFVKKTGQTFDIYHNRTGLHMKFFSFSSYDILTNVVYHLYDLDVNWMNNDKSYFQNLPKDTLEAMKNILAGS